MVNLDLFICFAVVAEEMSFRKAAMRLSKDQSWLSRRIRSLEEYVGTLLFLRDTRSVELTPDGEALLPFAQALAEQATKTQGFAREMRNSLVKRLRIGAAAYSAYIPQRVELVGNFMTRHPNVNVSVQYGLTPVLVSRIRQRKIDIAFVAAPFDDKGLEKHLLKRSYGGLWVPAEHELASLDAIEVEDLEGQQIAALPNNIKSKLRELINDRLSDAGAILVTMPETERSAIRYYARLQRLCAFSFDGPDDSEFQASDMVFRPITEPAICREMYAIRNPDIQSAPANWFWESVLRSVAPEEDKPAAAVP